MSADPDRGDAITLGGGRWRVAAELTDGDGVIGLGHIEVTLDVDDRPELGAALLRAFQAAYDAIVAELGPFIPDVDEDR